jgi:hypothetical protein
VERQGNGEGVEVPAIAPVALWTYRRLAETAALHKEVWFAKMPSASDLRQFARTPA